MIGNFADKEVEKVWGGTPSRRLPANIQSVARRKLADASLFEDLRICPAHRFGVLKGARNGQHSIQFNDQWRICLTSSAAVESRWVEAESCDVEIVDDH